jgi:hypothetical protein
MYKYYLSVLAIFKNESSGIKEWITHYMSEGVEHFYLIDNGSTDNWEEEVKGFPITVRTDDKKHAQIEHYNSYMDQIKKETEWIMVVDLDEYVYSRESTIANTLRGYEDSIGNIMIRWKMFGSNGHINQPKSLISGFTKRSTEMDDLNVKSIIKTNILRTLLIHRQDYISKGGVKEIFQPDECTEESLAKAKLHLNHYAIQSREFFEKVKMQRGSANVIAHDNVRTWDYFARYDANDVEDLELFNKKSI